MALTKITTRDNVGHEQGADRQVVIEHNRLVSIVESLLLKLDADVGVTDTNYTALLGSGTASGSRQVADSNGNVIA